MADVTVEINIECSECRRTVDINEKGGIVLVIPCNCKLTEIENLQERIEEKERIIDQFEQDTMKS